MNLAFARVFTTQSSQGITGQRNTRHYKEILETFKAAAHKQPVPIQPVRVHDAGSAWVRLQPAPGTPVTIAQGLLDPIKIGEDLGRGEAPRAARKRSVV